MSKILRRIFKGKNQPVRPDGLATIPTEILPLPTVTPEEDTRLKKLEAKRLQLEAKKEQFNADLSVLCTDTANRLVQAIENSDEAVIALMIKLEGTNITAAVLNMALLNEMSSRSIAGHLLVEKRGKEAILLYERP